MKHISHSEKTNSGNIAFMFLMISFIGLVVLLITGCGPNGGGGSSKTTHTINGTQITCPTIITAETNILCRVGAITNRTVRTPKGAYVWVEPGATIEPADLNAIDTGLTRAFTKSACKGWTGGASLLHSGYVVAVFAAPDRDSQGNPAYRIPCGQYCGSEYDKGGYILVAGQMAATGTPYGNVIIIPDPAMDKLPYAEAGTEYEAEHVILSYFDGELFTATITHLGSGHPIFSCTPGLMAAKPKAATAPVNNNAQSIEVRK